MFPKALCLTLLVLSAQAFPLVVQRSAPTFGMFGAPFTHHIANFDSFLDIFGHFRPLHSSTGVAQRLTDSRALFDISLPSGFEPGDLDVAVEGSRLHVTCSSSTPTSEHHFSRTITLPFAVESSADLTALLDKAASRLHLSVPRPHSATPAAVADQVAPSRTSASTQHADAASGTIGEIEVLAGAEVKEQAIHKPPLTREVTRDKTSQPAPSDTPASNATTATKASPQDASSADSDHSDVGTAANEVDRAAATGASSSFLQTTNPDPLAGLTEEQVLQLLRQKFGTQFGISN